MMGEGGWSLFGVVRADSEARLKGKLWVVGEGTRGKAASDYRFDGGGDFSEMGEVWGRGG